MLKTHSRAPLEIDRRARKRPQAARSRLDPDPYAASNEIRRLGSILAGMLLASFQEALAIGRAQAMTEAEAYAGCYPQIRIPDERPAAAPEPIDRVNGFCLERLDEDSPRHLLTIDLASVTVAEIAHALALGERAVIAAGGEL